MPLSNRADAVSADSYQSLSTIPARADAQRAPTRTSQDLLCWAALVAGPLALVIVRLTAGSTIAATGVSVLAAVVAGVVLGALPPADEMIDDPLLPRRRHLAIAAMTIALVSTVVIAATATAP